MVATSPASADQAQPVYCVALWRGFAAVRGGVGTDYQALAASLAAAAGATAQSPDGRYWVQVRRLTGPAGDLESREALALFNRIEHFDDYATRAYIGDFRGGAFAFKPWTR